VGELDSIFKSDAIREVTFEYKGTPVKVKLGEASWSEKNKILTKCFTYKNDGSVSFDLDRYVKDMIRKIVLGITVGSTAVPEINDIFFTRLNPEFGSLLEKLVPKAFEETTVPDFFGSEPKA